LIVLDTHAWIWYIDTPENLGETARRAIDHSRESGGGLHISCISTWEFYMLVERGRLSLTVPAEVWVSRCEKISFLTFQPVDNDIARLSVTACSDMHGDPADRIITATALYLGAKLISRDTKIRQSGIVECIW